MSTSINLDSTSGFTIVTGSNGLQNAHMLLTTGTYTFTGTGSGMSGISSIIFNMDHGADVTLDGGALVDGVIDDNLPYTIFNKPVDFRTTRRTGENHAGRGRILNFIGKFVFNYSTLINPVGSASGGTAASRVNIGTNDFPAYMSFSNDASVDGTDPTSGNANVRFTGVGLIYLLNALTVIDLNINPYVPGLNNYLPTGNLINPGNSATLNVIIGPPMAEIDSIQLNAYVTIQIGAAALIYNVIFRTPITAEIDSITGNRIIIQSQGVVFIDTRFEETFAPEIDTDCDLTIRNCEFVPESGSALNITGPGTFYFGDGNSIIPVDGQPILSVTDSPTLEMASDSTTSVYLPQTYTYSNDEEDICQQFTYVSGWTGCGYTTGCSYTFGTSGNEFGLTGSPLNFSAQGGVSASLSTYANSGLSVTATDTGTDLVITGSSIRSSSANVSDHNENGIGVAVKIRTSDGATVDFAADEEDVSRIYATDGLLLFDVDVTPTGYYRCYLVGNDANTLASWHFDSYEYNNASMLSIVDGAGGVYLDTNDRSYSIVLGWNDGNNDGELVVRNSSTSRTPIADLNTVTNVTLVAYVGMEHANSVRIASQLQLDFDSCSVLLHGDFYDDVFNGGTPLVITGGDVTASQSLTFHMSHADTYPYTGSFDSIQSGAKINLSPGTYDFDITDSDNASWYTLPIFPVNSDSYVITSINNSGLVIANNDPEIIPQMELTSTYQITIDVGEGAEIDLHDGTLSNSGASNFTVLSLPGDGNVQFSGSPVFNVYGTGTINEQGSSHSGNDVVTVNYYANTYDFSIKDRSLEYDHGINLKSSSVYIFDNTGSRLVTYVADAVAAQIEDCTFNNGLTVNTSSSQTVLLADLVINLSETGDALRLLGSGSIGMTGGTIDVPGSGDSTSQLIEVGSEDTNGSLDVTFATVTIQKHAAASFTYGMKIYTTGTVNTGDLDFSDAANTPIYWPTLANTVSDAPYVSSVGHVAVSYDPESPVQLQHGDLGFYQDENLITSLQFTVASGAASDNVTSKIFANLNVTSYGNFADSDYAGDDITAIFTPDSVYAGTYFGGLVTSSVGHKTKEYTGVTTSVRKRTVTVNFADAENMYVGNMTVEVELEPQAVGGASSEADYGVIPVPSYSIAEDVDAPELTITPDEEGSIEVHVNVSSQAPVYVDLSRTFALPVYIFPILNTDGDNAALNNAATYLMYQAYSVGDDSSSFIPYATYIDPDNNAGLVQHLEAGVSQQQFILAFRANTGIYYPGAATALQLHLHDAHTDEPLYTSTRINIVNTEDNLLCPLISLNGEYVLSVRNTTTIYGRDPDDDDEEGVFSKQSNYSGSYITYDLSCFVMMPVYTFDDTSHVITITGTQSDLAYEFSGDTVTDNGDGTATMVFGGNDLSYHPLNINVTTNHVPSHYPFANVQELPITLTDQKDLKKIDGTAISPDTQSATSWYNFPPVVLIGCNGDSSFADLYYQDDPSFTFHKDTVSDITAVLVGSIDGSVNTSFEFPLNIYINNGSDDSGELMGYTIDSSGSNPNPVYFTYGTGEYSLTKTMSFTQDNRISGDNAYYYMTVGTGTLNTSVSGEETRTIFPDTVNSTTLHDVSRDHTIHVYLGFGSSTAADETYINSGTTSQEPSSYTVDDDTKPDRQPTTKELGMNIGIGPSSIPYIVNDPAVPYTGFRMNFIFKGQDVDGSLVTLTPGTNIFVYDNPDYEGSYDLSGIYIDASLYNESWNESDNWVSTSNNTLYLVQGIVEYDYIRVYYYVSDMDSNCDYSGLPTDPVSLATFDFTEAPSGSISARFISIGNWQIRSNQEGHFIIRNLGTYTDQEVGDDGAGAEYIIRKPTVTAEHDIDLASMRTMRVPKRGRSLADRKAERKLRKIRNLLGVKKA